MSAAVMTPDELATLAEHDARWRKTSYFFQPDEGRPWWLRLFDKASQSYSLGDSFEKRADAQRALRSWRNAQRLAEKRAPKAVRERAPRAVQPERASAPPAPLPVSAPAPKAPRAPKAVRERPSTVVTFVKGADPKERRRIESIARRGWPLASLPKPVVISFGGALMSQKEAARVVDTSGLTVADTWPKLLNLLKRNSASDYPGLTASDYLAAMGETYREGEPVEGEPALHGPGAWSCGCKGREAEEPCQRHARCVSWEAFNEHEDAGPKTGRKKAS